MDVIAGIQAALDIAGKLRELSKKVQDADFSILLADLTMQLADTKLEVASLKTELAKEKEEKEALAKRLSNKCPDQFFSDTKIGFLLRCPIHKLSAVDYLVPSAIDG